MEILILEYFFKNLYADLRKKNFPVEYFLFLRTVQMGLSALETVPKLR